LTSLGRPAKLKNDLEATVKRLAVNAVRLAAMTQLGPLAGGLFLAGGAVAGKIFAESKWAETSAEMLMHLASDKASELLGSAVEGFRSGHNGDIEKSMQKAALEALGRLSADAPSGFNDWFEDWRSYLTFRPAAEVFAAVPDLNPIALNYDDNEFRDLWWNRMEPVLAGWRKTEASGITQLHLSGPNTLPPALSAFLRERLPEALHAAHEDLLREPELQRSWIGFQQRVYRETLNQLQAIRHQLNRIEDKLDVALDGRTNPPPGPVWNIPQPTRHFHDRPDLIAQIDQALEQHGVTALTALHGLGGIGKTQLARRFAQLRRTQYKLGAWIEAESEADILSGLAALAPLLGIKAEQEQKATVARVINELSAREPWLLIFDNADSPETLRPYVERLSGKGHVLITSRNQHWDDLAAPVSVTEWSVEESSVFLLDRTLQSGHARTAAEVLAKDLGGLVLALEHAAAYMRLGDGTTLTEYRRIWQERLKQEVKGHAYDRSVAATLGLSLDRVGTESPVAYDLLCLFAWLAPDRIPRKELLEAGASKLPEALSNAFADPDKWIGIIETLGRYSLLKLLRDRPDGPVTEYSVHRVVQQLLRDRQAVASTNSQWLTAACDLVSAAFSFDPGEPQFRAASAALLPHARALRQHGRDMDRPASLGRLLNETAIYLRVRGLYSEARDFQDLALELDLRQLGPDHPTVAAHRSNLAIILGYLGEHGEARKQIELALESGLLQFGPEHPEVAARRSNLAASLMDLGEHGEARKQIELALESALLQFGPDHPTVAVRRSNLAVILRNLGEYGEAQKQIELALESALRQFGPDHPNVAIYRSNLANVLGDLGEHEEARKQIELALESDLRQFGPDHPEVAVRRSNLANILRDLGHHGKARKQIELALESKLRQFGPDHPAVAISRLNLAVILHDLKKSEAARREIDLALDTFRKKLPLGHPHIRGAERWRETILLGAADLQTP
jgi:tetratricopeptide (TPR) repeat protein